MSFDKYIDRVLEHEGGYVNDPTDAGGETKWGISKRAYPHLDIKNLSKSDAKEIYRKDYWNANHCDKLPEGLDYVHFDTAVNMGGRRAAKILQQASGVTVDGIIGRNTLAAAKNTTPAEYLLHRLNFYCQIVRGRHSQARFIGGWANRTMDVLNTIKQ